MGWDNLPKKEIQPDVFRSANTNGRSARNMLGGGVQDKTAIPISTENKPFMSQLSKDF